MPYPHPAFHPGLLPPGQRWGRGAQSVVPYLAATRTDSGASGQGGASTDAIRNPVFPQMDVLLARRDH